MRPSPFATVSALSASVAPCACATLAVELNVCGKSVQFGYEPVPDLHAQGACGPGHNIIKPQPCFSTFVTHVDVKFG